MKSPDGRECSTFSQDKKIALSDKRSTTLYLLNPNKRTVEKIQVDGCAITEGARCDWLVLLNDTNPREEIYVELKGSDVDRAVEQLESTIKRLSSDPARLQKRCFVVLNRNPMTGTDVQKTKDRFFRNFKAVFKPERNKAEVLL